MLRVGGVILCGGRSSRMGRPKAWLPMGDETMLGRVVRLVGEVVSPVVVVAAPGQEVPPLPTGTLVVRDPAEGRGPLQGLAVGLESLRGQADAAYVSSCDVPFLQPAFVRRMIDLLGEHAACVPEVEGRLHPLAGVYRLEVADAAGQLLAEGCSRAVFLVERVPARIVGPQELANLGPSFPSLRNLNTPADYDAAVDEQSSL
jgi:molybdopterin-guanine dinucleotide biosynthesis protein A